MSATTHRVLIAEDDALIAAVIQAELEKIGATVVGIASDGVQAITLTGQLHPDVVLLDIEMPEMDGLQAAQHIQATCPTPLVVLTVYDDATLVQQAAAAGIGAYLLKPPQAGDLERAITIARARFADLLELRRLNAELTAYDHSVSHDLKNPLGNIYTTAAFLLQEHAALAGPDLENWLQEILNQAHRATNIIDSLLLLGRPAEIPLDPLNMHDIIMTVLHDQALAITRTQAHIVQPESWPQVYGQVTLIEQVWDNYLSNALKYGGRPPHIELGYDAPVNGQVRFWVRDNGLGISKEERQQLFKPFVRLTPTHVGGHGLGLFLARRIVEQLGGQVGLEHDPQGGSLFYFTLPDQQRVLS